MTNSYKVLGIKTKMDPNALTRKMTGLHKEMPEIRPSLYYENLLTQLRQKKYSRKGFDFEKPKKKDVATLLEEEANIIYESETKEKDKKVADYVASHIEKAFSDRQKQWLRLADYFEQLEDYNEDKQNQVFNEAFLEEKSKLEKHISGDEKYVMSATDAIFSKMILPYDLKVKIDYAKQNRCVVVDAELPFDLGLPTFKRVNLVRAGLAYKDKLQREITQETTDSIFSLAYYLAGQLFSVSVNICYVQVAIWKSGHSEGQLWIEFERDRFAALDTKNFAPDADVFNWTHIMNEKIVRGAMRLDAIEQNTFTLRIKRLEAGGVTHSNFIKSSNPLQKRTSCVLSLDDAKLIGNNIADNQEIKEAIELADAEGKTSVVLPLKYEKFLSEIKKMN